MNVLQTGPGAGLGCAVWLAAALMACGSARDERLPSERLPSQCSSDAQCGTLALCQSGACISTEGALVIGKVQGAPLDAQVTSQQVGNEVCAPHTGQGLVCTLATDGRVVLIAPSVPGYRFMGWSGERCQGTTPTLDLTHIDRKLVCTALFAKQLVVRGTVADDPSLPLSATSTSPTALCQSDQCAVDPNEPVVLTAPPRDGEKLTGFDGPGCEDVDGYRVTVRPTDHDVTCVAQYTASLTARGQAQGLKQGAVAAIVASSATSGAQCDGPLCAFDPGADVTLQAPNLDGYRLTGWTGEERCLANGPAVSIANIASSLVCNADYVARYAVDVLAEGATPPAGALRATSSGALAACSDARCVVDEGQDVALVAGTIPGFRVASWSGDGCTASGGAGVLVSGVARDTACTAHYVPGVSVTGTLVNASGEVEATSTSAGASCGHGSCTIDAGGEVALTAPALPGRKFLGWSGDAGCAGGALRIVLGHVTSSLNCFATYAPRFSVSARALPAVAGTVVASSSAPNASCGGARCDVNQNAAVALQQSTSPGFRFSGWNGDPVCSGGQVTLALTNIASDVSCNANFVGRVQVSGDAMPANGGTIMASAPTSTSAMCSQNTCSIDAGGDVTLSTQPAAGFSFAGWTGCGGPSSALSLPVRGALVSQNCTAHFEPLSYVVNGVAGPGGSVRASGPSGVCANATCTVGYGAAVSMLATPEAGYAFAGWTGCTGSSADLDIAGVTSSATCTASFARIRVALAGSVSPVGVATVLASSDAPNAACTGAACEVDWGSAAELDADANPAGYRFAGWSGCDAAQVSGASVLFASLTSNASCQARYVKQWTVTAASSNPRYGSTNCGGGCPVDQGGSVALTSTAASGYRLASWTCSTGTMAATDVLSLSNIGADVNCVADFEAMAQ